MRPHRSAQTTEIAEVEPQKAEALTPSEVDDTALLIIDFDLQLGEFLAQSLFHRRNQPVMSLVGINQDHQIVRESRIFDWGELAIAGDIPRLLQHPIHLIEVNITEQGRNYSALWDASLARSFQHDLQKMHDVGVINPSCHFFQQPVVPDIVKGSGYRLPIAGIFPIR